MIWLALMFASGIGAIAGGVLMGDWGYAALAAGVLATCCLLLAYGHGAFESRASKQQRADAERAFEDASHEAYLRLVERARRG